MVVTLNAMKIIDEVTYKLWEGPLRRPFRAAVRRMIGDSPQIILGPMRGRQFSGGTFHHRVGVYELHIQHMMERVLAEGGVLYDIGANYGFLSLLGSQLVGPSGHVYTFEPLPENIRRIEAVMSENGVGNYTLVPVALSNMCGSVNFYFDEGDSHATPSLDRGTRGLAVEVSTITLDAFVAGHRWPSLIKMDIEGGEAHALEGAKEILSSAAGPSWVIEVHSAEKDRAVTEMLITNGYHVRLIVPPYAKKRPYPRQIFAAKGGSI